MRESNSLRGARLRPEEVFPMVDGWMMEDKISLMNHVLGGESGLVVALVHPGSIHCQINRMSRDQLIEVIRAVSLRLAQLP